jgi:hypothetical protein
MALPTIPRTGRTLAIVFRSPEAAQVRADYDAAAKDPDADPDVLAALDGWVRDAAPDVTVSFRTQVPSGADLERLYRAHPAADDGARWNLETFPPALIAASVIEWCSSETPGEVAALTEDDAVELWETWPQWARRELFTALYAQATDGPVVDPFSRSTPNAPGG